MRIKLISPRMSYRPMDSAFKTHMAPPLSLLVLGALTPHTHSVAIADENVERVRLDDNPDLVGITVKVDTARRSWQIADAYRKRGVQVVLGGIHPTMCPQDNAPHADAVVIGEAETLWRDILDDAACRRLKSTYRCAGGQEHYQPPVPRWKLIDGKNYLYINTLTTGRGCPWSCGFCYNSSPNIESRHRTKPVENVLAEIASLSARHVMFIDDNFIGNPKAAKELVRRLKPLRLTWHTAVSADIGRHDDLLDMMADSGCKSLYIGFESINAASLASCKKRQNQVAAYDETIAKIHDRGMMVNASLVFGFDGDDAGVFDSTLDWLLRNRLETMTAHILTPYPGTPLYRQLLDEGRITDFNLDHYNTSRVVFRPANMSVSELQNGYEGMYRRFYSWKNIWLRMPDDPRRRNAYLAFNLIYRKLACVAAALGRLGLMGRIGRICKAIAYPKHGTFH